MDAEDINPSVPNVSLKVLSKTVYLTVSDEQWKEVVFLTAYLLGKLVVPHRKDFTPYLSKVSDTSHHFQWEWQPDLSLHSEPCQRQGCPGVDHKLPPRISYHSLLIECWQCVCLSVKGGRRSRFSFFYSVSESVIQYGVGWNTLVATSSQVWAALFAWSNFFSCNGGNYGLITLERYEVQKNSERWKTTA